MNLAYELMLLYKGQGSLYVGFLAMYSFSNVIVGSELIKMGYSIWIQTEV